MKSACRKFLCSLFLSFSSPPAYPNTTPVSYTHLGTITIGNRKATHFHTAPGVNLHDFVETCLLSSLSDETPEGKSIVELGRESGMRMRNLNTTGAVSYTHLL